MRNFLSRFFTNERLVGIAILLNVTSIILEEYGINHPAILAIDDITTLFFLGEMIAKLAKLGILDYCRSGWNRLDGALVLISIPSILDIFFPGLLANLSNILILRTFRIVRIARISHFFPALPVIIRNLRKALKDSSAIMIGFVIMILTFSLLSCSLFRNAAPQFFSNPTESFYATFRLFTIEGWYEIPDAVTANFSAAQTFFTRLYFSSILIICGILGMSLLNSIFVDAMVSDNNDELINEIHRLEEKVDKLLEQQNNSDKNESEN